MLATERTTLPAKRRSLGAQSTVVDPAAPAKSAHTELVTVERDVCVCARVRVREREEGMRERKEKRRQRQRCRCRYGYR